MAIQGTNGGNRKNRQQCRVEKMKDGFHNHFQLRHRADEIGLTLPNFWAQIKKEFPGLRQGDVIILSTPAEPFCIGIAVPMGQKHRKKRS